MNKPRVYLAGKIAKNCWRHTLVPRLRGALTYGYMVPQPIDCETFIYTGPFFASCDHGCTHGEATHGTGRGGCVNAEAPTREEVFRRNNLAIASADIVIAYISAYDCIGTVWEIAFAQHRKIPVYMIFHPDIDRPEFWVPAMLAEPPVAHLSRTVTKDHLPSVVKRVIETWRPRN